MTRFCPQCGRRTAFSSTATTRERNVDAEGFCVSRHTGRGKGWKNENATHEGPDGCEEHLVRFDGETGARLAPVETRHVRAWAGAT